MIQESRLVLLPFRWMLIRPPISIIEAMSLEKCIITTNMSGNLELITHEHNGIIANFSQIGKVRAILEDLLNDTTHRMRLARQAKKTIINMYCDTEYSEIIESYLK